jgi:glycosyltransferase involved in cell wall biosynthesis
MRIGIDATCWWNRRGFGRFTRGLLPAMFSAARGHRFCLFVDQAPEPEMFDPNVQIVEVSSSRPLVKSAVAGDRRSLRDIRRLSRAVASQQLDVMFFPAVYSWFPVGRRTPTALILHDAIAEHLPQLVFPDRMGRFFWGLKMRLACRSASQIITVSQTAKREIVQYIGIRPERIEVICEGAGPNFAPVNAMESRAAARSRVGIPPDDRLLVYVGGMAPHKNLLNLLAGFAEVAPSLPNVCLAIVGDPAGDGFYSNFKEVKALAEADVRLRGRIHFTGFVSDGDLPALYSDALATVLPSFSEGFGLPALESLCCGTPVLASRTGAVAEVIGGAGLTFDPHSPTEIGQQIFRIAHEPALLAELRRLALERSRDYSWSKAADLTLRCLEHCAAGS